MKIGTKEKTFFNSLSLNKIFTKNFITQLTLFSIFIENVNLNLLSTHYEIIQIKKLS